MTLELHATPEDVMRAVAALQEFGEARMIPAQTLFSLTLALEECASNIVNHALHRDARQTFHVRWEATPNQIVIELRDPGPPFDPTQLPATAAQADDDRPPGGWGIFLVRRHLDEIHYSRVGGENVLRLTKKTAASPERP